jgi:ubiquinol-cytochrome c reductase cytochrome b subunit
VETGIIRQMPNGEYIELTTPVSEEMRAVLEARAELPQIEAPAGDEVPAARGPVGKLRVSLNRVLTENIPLPHGNGHGNGHAAEPTAVTAADTHPDGAERDGGDGAGA